MEDTTEALRLQPDNVKALFRRALAKKVCVTKNKISGIHVSKKTRGKSLVTRHFLFRSLSLIG